MGVPYLGLDNRASKTTTKDTSVSKCAQVIKSTGGQSDAQSAPQKKAVFSIHQLLELEKQFKENGVLCQPKRRQVSTHLGLQERQVPSSIRHFHHMFVTHFTIIVEIALAV